MLELMILREKLGFWGLKLGMSIWIWCWKRQISDVNNYVGQHYLLLLKREIISIAWWYFYHDKSSIKLKLRISFFQIFIFWIDSTFFTRIIEALLKVYVFTQIIVPDVKWYPERSFFGVLKNWFKVSYFLTHLLILKTAFW